METVKEITPDQWQDLATLVEAALLERGATGRPIELCHQYVRCVLGYRWDVDYYDALIRCYATVRPRPDFSMKIKSPHGSLPHTMLLFTSNSAGCVDEGIMAKRSACE